MEAGAGAGAGAGPGPGPPQAPKPAGPDWARGLPDELLVKVAATHAARTEADWAARLRARGWSEEEIQEKMAKREHEGRSGMCVFAMVCKPWRKAQLKVGGRLCTRVKSDVILPGSVELAKWALAEGCPREAQNPDTYDIETLATVAARYGHLELVQWLCGERGFALDKGVFREANLSGNLELVRWLVEEQGFAVENSMMIGAASSGSLELLRWLRAKGCNLSASMCAVAAAEGHREVLRWARANGCPWDTRTCHHAALYGNLPLLQWLRGEGCPWDWTTCHHAIDEGHVEVLRWARENGCPWWVEDRDRAAEELGYTDNFGNLVD